MRIIRWADLSDAPWKNGGGVTREIIKEPANGNEFDWRVSVAEIRTEGPFSLFPGCERHIAVVRGDGMTLDFGDDRMVQLHPLSPHAFLGDDQVSGLLPFGPVSDMNLMVRRSYGRGKITFGRLSKGSFPAGLADQHQLVHVISGSCQGMGGSLETSDSLYIPPGEYADLAGQAVISIAAIRAD